MLPARSRPRRPLVLVSAVAAGALLAGGCGSSDPALELLESDAMASHKPSHATLLDQFEQDSGTTLGKPHYAQITRVFEVGTAASPIDVVAATAETAQDHGWRGHFVSTRAGNSGWTGTREQADLRLELDITGDQGDYTDGDLLVYLHAYPR